MPDRPKRRALLVASIGVATVSYMVACDPHPSAGNLSQPQPTSTSPVAGNLMPVPPPDASTPVATDGDAGAPVDVSPVAGNLMVAAPPSASASAKKPSPPAPLKPSPPHPVTGNLAPPSGH